MQKISAVIITFNEERNMLRCLQSLDGIADEIIVVDSFSTDATKEICRQY
ncbi:MAG: glycosyltransferase, partial [Prevotellaceae bacterium]|nr:glycosyltransferase [Prevotellaceae bacterium]